jgi:hypothetical protein
MISVELDIDELNTQDTNLVKLDFDHSNLHNKKISIAFA